MHNNNKHYATGSLQLVFFSSLCLSYTLSYSFCLPVVFTLQSVLAFTPPIIFILFQRTHSGHNPATKRVQASQLVPSAGMATNM